MTLKERQAQLLIHTAAMCGYTDACIRRDSCEVRWTSYASIGSPRGSGREEIVGRGRSYWECFCSAMNKLNSLVER